MRRKFVGALPPSAAIKLNLIVQMATKRLRSKDCAALASMGSALLARTRLRFLIRRMFELLRRGPALPTRGRRVGEAL